MDDRILRTRVLAALLAGLLMSPPTIAQEVTLTVRSGVARLVAIDTFEFQLAPRNGTVVSGVVQLPLVQRVQINTTVQVPAGRARGGVRGAGAAQTQWQPRWTRLSDALEKALEHDCGLVFTYAGRDAKAQEDWGPAIHNASAYVPFIQLTPDQAARLGLPGLREPTDRYAVLTDYYGNVLARWEGVLSDRRQFQLALNSLQSQQVIAEAERARFARYCMAWAWQAVGADRLAGEEMSNLSQYRGYAGSVLAQHAVAIRQAQIEPALMEVLRQIGACPPGRRPELARRARQIAQSCPGWPASAVAELAARSAVRGRLDPKLQAILDSADRPNP